MATLTHDGRKGKAKRLQKWVAGKISELIGLPVGRDEPIESRQMGENGVDVRLDSQARKLFPFSPECKNCESWDVPGAIRQAKANCYANTDWIVFFNKNNADPVVILDANVFFSILKRAQPKSPRQLL